MSYNYGDGMKMQWSPEVIKEKIRQYKNKYQNSYLPLKEKVRKYEEFLEKDIPNLYKSLHELSAKAGSIEFNLPTLTGEDNSFDWNNVMDLGNNTVLPFVSKTSDYVSKIEKKVEMAQNDLEKFREKCTDKLLVVAKKLDSCIQSLNDLNSKYNLGMRRLK